jgi:hypothetical protein
MDSISEISTRILPSFFLAGEGRSTGIGSSSAVEGSKVLVSSSLGSESDNFYICSVWGSAINKQF